MSGHTIGVDIDDFRLPPKEALRQAAELSFRAVEFSVTLGETAPNNLTSSGRRHLARYVQGLGLDIAALTADFSGLRLTDPLTAQERIDRTCQILDLAYDLKVPIVTASVGALTHSQTGEPSPLIIEALKRIGEHADARGRIFALRPSHDAVDGLAKALDAVRCPAIGWGLDPAALVMTGVNPLAVIERFSDSIALVHARDATAGDAHRSGRETRLGEGEVDIVGVLSTLDAAEFNGAFLLRRTDSQTPLADLRQARETLSRLLA